MISFDRTKITIEDLAKAIATTGYKPTAYTQDKKPTPISGITASKYREEVQEIFKEEAGAAAKCSSGKCGAGKCGDSK